MLKRYKPLKYILALLLIFILIVGSYLIYVLTSYYRIEDHQELMIQVEGIHVTEDGKIAMDGDYSLSYGVPVGKELTVTSWNIGFGAYTDEYSFFMDGGKYSRGFSEEAVRGNVEAMAEKLVGFDSDFYLIQEVDTDATRSYHIDQKEILTKALAGKAFTFALNYDSPYLFYPFTEPHGKSMSGLLTLSDYEIVAAERRSLPIQDDLAKLVDLDRCYTVNRIPAPGDKELVLYNFHLSAYTTDPTIANQQLAMLYEDMAAEYADGNYVVCGGDFNKDLLGDSSKIFGVSGTDFGWAQPLPTEDIPEGFRLAAPYNPEAPVPSCRNADRPWNPENNFQVTIDGFLVSDNVEVISSDVVDFQFAYSDHNPVQMRFILK